MLFLGCTGGTEPSALPELTRINPDWITPEVARHVGPDGFFSEISATPESPWELDKATITPIVTGFVRTFLSQFVDPLGLEGRHGALISFERLAACGRTLYLVSSFEPLLISNSVIPQNLQWVGNSVDGSWLIRYCDGSTRILFITVLARTGLRLKPDGTVDFSIPVSKGSNEITPSARPLGRADLFPPPEEAVQTVFLGTGQRIAEIPQAIQNLVPFQGGNVTAGGIFWRIRTENPVEGRRGPGGAPVATREFYVSLNTSPDSGRVLVADPEPQAPFWFKTSALPSDSLLIVPRWSRTLYPFVRED